jgi:hypothetical protein
MSHGDQYCLTWIGQDGTHHFLDYDTPKEVKEQILELLTVEKVEQDRIVIFNRPGMSVEEFMRQPGKTAASPTEVDYSKGKWVQLVKDPEYPCTLNGVVFDGKEMEFVVEIDGTTDYHTDFNAAMKDYVTRVAKYSEGRG